MYKPINELKTGMIVRQDVFDSSRRLVVPKGVVLTKSIITRIPCYNIPFIDIEEDSFDEMDTVKDEISEKIYIEDIKQSPQFKKFNEDFTKCADSYKKNLTKALLKEEPLVVENLVKETTDLLNEIDPYSLFDILINMENTAQDTYNHCIDVSLIAFTLAKWLKFSEDEQKIVAACGLLHDIGKTQIDENLLNKPGRLTREEFEIIKQHPLKGFQFLQSCDGISQDIKDAVLMHHEKCDGSGYPYGLKDDEITKYAKIITIADMYDAMTNKRSYREPYCPFDVIRQFEAEGIQKFELPYILTFLEKVANSYINHKVTLSNGMEGNVIFINRHNLSKPVILTSDNTLYDIEKEYYSQSNRDIREDIRIKEVK